MSEPAEASTAVAKSGRGAVSGLPVLPPLAAVIEVIVLVVVPGLLDLFVPAFPSLNETQPHFYWLPVLLLTLQYGSASGLLAAGTAIVLSNLLGWPEQEIGENHFSYLLRIWLQPVLWLATGVILGQLRLRQIERKQALGQAVAELSAQRQSLADHAQSLRERCDRLERLISTRRGPDARDLLAALGRVEAAPADEATRALDEALGLAFGESAVSILALDGGALRVVYRHARPGAPPPPGLIGPESPLFAAVAIERRALSVLTPGAEHDLDRRGLAAVPIIASDGHLEGAVLLETGEPDDLDEGTCDRLRAIAAMVSGRLRTADRARTSVAAAPYVEPRPSLREGIWRRVRWQSGRHSAAASARATGRSGP
jgi:hypothetical protein